MMYVQEAGRAMLAASSDHPLDNEVAGASGKGQKREAIASLPVQSQSSRSSSGKSSEEVDSSRARARQDSKCKVYLVFAVFSFAEIAGRLEKGIRG